MSPHKAIQWYGSLSGILAAELCTTLGNPMDFSTPRLICPPLSPTVCSNWCPLSQWCYLTISSSAAYLSFCLPSSPGSGYFPMSRLFTSDGQSIGISASTSVLPVNIQGWFLLVLAGLISLPSKHIRLQVQKGKHDWLSMWTAVFHHELDLVLLFLEQNFPSLILWASLNHEAMLNKCLCFIWSRIYSIGST